MNPRLKVLIAAVALASGISANVLTESAEFIEDFECMVTTAYPDPANPNIPTICMGETQDVNFGDKYTEEQCWEMLVKRLPDYILPINKLLPDLPENRQIAYASATWNLGTGLMTWRTKRCVQKDLFGNCTKKVEIPGTSIVDLERAGNTQAACDRLLLFDKAGGKVLNGLTIRRKKERKICLGEP